jgi:diadenylate cyclase
MNVLKEGFLDLAARISSIGFFDVIDIIIVSVIFYYTYRFVRDRRAGKLALGILFVILALLISNVLGMQALSFLIQNIVQVGMIGVIILFQSELRTFLEKMGGQSILQRNKKKDRKYFSETVKCIDAVVEAATDFSAEKTGALIVFERTTKLGDVIKTGTVIDAESGAYMIKNIFFNKAPMHDGALIIRNNRLYSAGCFLPLSVNPEIVKDLGTRHRAGIGMSENSDAVVVIVSEETGTISLAVDGRITRDYDNLSLKKALLKLLVADSIRKNTKPAEKKGADNETV